MSEASHGTSAKAQGRVGTVIAGRWRVDERIGAGGMATVYAVTNRQGHRAALKMLHANLSRDHATRARFLREGYVANAIAHPGVVRVEDDGLTDDGVAFLVLELLEGETIEARRLRLGGALPLEEVLDTADQALDALAAAHEKQIIHRDVKPENFFLCHDGTVKLLDFGLARMKDGQGEATRTGVTIGTPEFMPPEQALGRQDAIDARSDVWGLGATMFNAITGQYVHDAPTLHEQLMASATKRARPIRTLVPEVPLAIASVIDRALELDRNDRWQSAREMQQALRRARKSGETVALDRSTADGNDSLTFPITSKSPGTRAESSDTQQMLPRAVGPIDSSPTRVVNDAPEQIFGETALEKTVALDGSQVPSKLPVSPTPVTARMGSPGPQPSAAPYKGMTLPAFTPDGGVRAIDPGQHLGTPAGGIPSLHAPYMQPHGGQTITGKAAAPTLKSSARPLLFGIAVFVVSTLVGVYVAWHLLYPR